MTRFTTEGLDDWTILVYANGNNELEPEVYNSFKDIQSETVNSKVNIVVQLARASYDLVKVIRPSVKNSTKNKGTWNGVRRYLINSTETTDVTHLEGVNMADPHTLSNFIVWGMTHYPAKNIMVVLSGHGAGFAGAMTDLTMERPYIMDMKGIVRGFERSYKIIGRRIDALVLDACHMSMIEIWHEFALMKEKAIDNLIAPARNIPLEGLPINLIIRHLQQNINEEKSTVETINQTLNNLNSESRNITPLFSIDLNKEKFTYLKDIISEFGELLAVNNIDLIDIADKKSNGSRHNPLINLLNLNLFLAEISPIYQNNNAFHSINNKIKKALENIILTHSLDELEELSKYNKGGAGLFLPTNPKQYTALKIYYETLIFAKDNNWLKVLRNKEKETSSETTHRQDVDGVSWSARPIEPRYVVASILELNPHITEKEAWEIIKKIYINI